MLRYLEFGLGKMACVQIATYTAALAQWVGSCAAETKDAGVILTAVAISLMEAKSKNGRVLRFWCTLKIPTWSKRVALHYVTPHSIGISSLR